MRYYVQLNMWLTIHLSYVRILIMKYKIKINNKTTFILGAILGIVSKLLDINEFNTGLGNTFSEISIWILLGVIITLISKTKKDSMLNVFLFNIGMIFTYYVTAEITNSIYGVSYIKYWTKVALISPFLSFIVYQVKRKDYLGKLISILIIVSTIYIILRFGGPRYYDFIILFILIYLLYKERRNVL